jgi:uncharacterized membrane protein
LSYKLALTAVFTAFVAAATMVFSVYVPATAGFFNLGESAVFISALLLGPYVGAFAGGVGSMFADLLLGYPHYAPATLLIKACEGAIVGTLRGMRPTVGTRLHRQLLTLALGVLVGVLLGWIGFTYYSGDVELTLGSSIFLLYVPGWLWVVLGTATMVAIGAVGLLADPDFVWTVFSVLVGGAVMVLGYFLYQRFLIYPLFNIEVVAILEIPVNIGQMTIGALIALPIVRVVWRSLPNLKVE